MSQIFKFSQTYACQCRIWPSQQFFLILQLWSLIFLGRQIMFILISEKYFCTLLADNKLQHIIWKDLIHTCLETKNQCHGITFDVCYVGSKYHFFISYRGLFFKHFVILKKSLFHKLNTTNNSCDLILNTKVFRIMV